MIFFRCGPFTPNPATGLISTPHFHSHERCPLLHISFVGSIFPLLTRNIQSVLQVGKGLQSAFNSVADAKVPSLSLTIIVIRVTGISSAEGVECGYRRLRWGFVYVHGLTTLGKGTCQRAYASSDPIQLALQTPRSPTSNTSAGVPCTVGNRTSRVPGPNLASHPETLPCGSLP